MGKKFISFLCVLSVALSLFNGSITITRANENNTDNIAPVNPEFTRYMDQKSTGHKSVDGQPVSGYIPSPVALPSYKVPDYGQHFSINAVASLPARYDARDYGYITSIKDQRISGPCWAFAVTGVMESFLIKSGEAACDLSENHLMYASSSYGGNTEGKLNPPHSGGGNYYTSTAYYMRWGGPVLESSDPFPLQGPYDTARPISVTNSYAPIKHVESVIHLPDLSSTATAAEKTAHRNNVKQLITAYGSVGLGTYYDQNYQNSTATAYYYNGTALPNHGVAIIGWDDNYSKDNFKSTLKPPGNGAWLIKNSWGNYNSLGGYYYISYYDTYAEYNIMAIKSVAGTDNYDNIYYYDPMSATTYISRTGLKTCEFANVFNRNYRGEILKGVSFYNFSQNVNYQVYINTDLSASSAEVLNNTSFTLAAQGTLADAGYMTIPIAPTVINGSKFAVTVRITTTDGTDALVPIETSIPFAFNGSASPDQSFRRFAATDTWADVTTLDGYAMSIANVCVKAYTSDASGDVPLNILGSYPPNNAVNISTGTVPVITFDQKISAGSAYSDITFKAEGRDISFTPGIKNGTLTLTPTAALSSGTIYTITIPADSIQRLIGITLDSDYSLTFTTMGTLKPFVQYLPKTGQSNFYHPSDIAIDSNHNIYVADTGNNRIQKFDSSGTFIAQWGGYGTGNGQFYNPSYIDIDSADNVYVSDLSNSRIQKFNSSGDYISQWGAYGTGNGQLSDPRGIAIDSSDNVYVADSVNNRIQKFSSSGEYLTQWGKLGIGTAQFAGPLGIAADDSGNIYVADYGNDRIQKFSSSGDYISQWTTEDPIGIDVDKRGFVYVTNGDVKKEIKLFDAEGNFITKCVIDGKPTGITTDSDNNIYVADPSNNRILFANAYVTVTPLNIVSSNPVNNAAGILNSIAPSITFDQSISPGAAYNNITFIAGDTAVGFTPSISGNTLALTPSSALQPETVYTVTLPPGSVKNPSDKSLLSDYTLSFTTASLPPAPQVGADDINNIIIGLNLQTMEYAISENSGATFSRYTSGALPGLGGSKIVKVRFKANGGSDPSKDAVLTFTPNHGDVDGDGKINIADVIMAAEIAVGDTSYSAQQISRANVSDKTDPMVDIADVILIAERGTGGTTPFPIDSQL